MNIQQKEHYEHMSSDDYNSEAFGEEAKAIASMEQYIIECEGLEPVDLTGFGVAPQEDYPIILDFN